ncbi:zinc finger MYM-type protein 1-like [Sipha flava]|uniref:Zinc finger MYM-type protein 1-like n=1 Tax=Sipha flava TaxID=143950 RepID=A0A8B8F8F8_9HEMI|nr:zinc finger MYM-type protein 1-like [Sipha flava]
MNSETSTPSTTVTHITDVNSWSSDPALWPNKKNQVVQYWIHRSRLTSNQNLNNDFTASSRDKFSSGYSDWPHGQRDINKHERSVIHLESLRIWISRTCTSKTLTIDSQHKLLMEQQIFYWREVLRRVFETLRYLCGRGLALRGDSENFGDEQNGNFLVTLEYLSKFDPFIAKHLNENSNKGRGKKSYLSSTIYEECVLIMGNKLLKMITKEKFMNVSYVLNLLLVILEKNIAQAILKKLEELDLNILDARGQSYDNASNMSGKFEGVQVHLKKSNKYMDFIPCTAHSLNLVGNNAVDNCSAASVFFEFVQHLYTFCSASTYRWETICGDLKRIDGRTVVLKSLSETRWSSRAHSTKVLLLWNRILERFDKTSVKLQEKSLDLSVAVKLLKFLREYIGSIRNNFNDIEKVALSLSKVISKKYNTEKKKKNNS